ncbi:MAG TPA: lysylphosphatidylglycerol synthase domain-containing protein, partial [Acidobacteriota bacterium]|nr:lysylphosphatidylglycerol synthase domain-containing protein [Acidobacteriota bacterium]
MKKVLPYIGFLLFSAALWVLFHILRQYHYHEVAQHMASLPLRSILIALAVTFVNYGVLTGYDTLAFAYIKHPLPYRKIALASFVGYAFSQNLGFPLLTGGSVRFGLYSSWGLSTVEITQIVAFTSLTFWMGVLTIGGAALLLEPSTIHQALHLPQGMILPTGVLVILLTLVYLVLANRGPREMRIRNWTFVLPSPRLAVLQVAVSTFDWALAGLVLYVLLPPVPGISFAGFLGLFVVAQVAGVISHVPGGLGIFETAILLILSQSAEASIIMGSLLAYRIIYYLLPLVLSALALGAHEVFKRRRRVKRVAEAVGQWIPELAPPALAFLAFLGGIVLLFSGATPAAHGRVTGLEPWVPLPLVELSHFIGSLAGAGLLLLSRGLQRRLDAAHVLTSILMATGIVVSLLKGFDYEEAIILSLMLAALLPCRRFFYRKASLISEPFSRGWILAIVLVLAAAVWMILFSYKHVEYTNELWWQFAFRGNAPRSLRATMGAIVAAFLFALFQLLRPAPAEPEAPDHQDMQRVQDVVATNPESA